MIMKIFPKILVVRCYELDGIEVTYSSDWSQNNLDHLYGKLENELEHNKHLESYEIFHNWKNIWKEEDKIISFI